MPLAKRSPDSNPRSARREAPASRRFQNAVKMAMNPRMNIGAKAYRRSTEEPSVIGCDDDDDSVSTTFKNFSSFRRALRNFFRFRLKRICFQVNDCIFRKSWNAIFAKVLTANPIAPPTNGMKDDAEPAAIAAMKV